MARSTPMDHEFGEYPDDEGGGAWLYDPDGVGPRLVLLDVPEGKPDEPRTGEVGGP